MMFGKFNARPFKCPSCGVSLLVKLDDSEILVRCVRCRGSAIHLSMMLAIENFVVDRGDVCELSSRGALVRYLSRKFRSVSPSEYFDGTESGNMVDGVRCENVMSLTYADNQFDLFTCTEVFEHVADDVAGFKEVFRVLKNSGIFVFTVPLSAAPQTVERAMVSEGEVRHLLPAEFHGDRLRGRGKVLVFRDYGMDIPEKLKFAGFDQVVLFRPKDDMYGFSRTVIVAAKPGLAGAGAQDTRWH